MTTVPVYKCRYCGKEILGAMSTFYTPITALNWKIGQSAAGSLLIAHTCKQGYAGVCDLVGARDMSDPEDSAAA